MLTLHPSTSFPDGLDAFADFDRRPPVRWLRRRADGAQVLFDYAPGAPLYKHAQIMDMFVAEAGAVPDNVVPLEAPDV